MKKKSKKKKKDNTIVECIPEVVITNEPKNIITRMSLRSLKRVPKTLRHLQKISIQDMGLGDFLNGNFDFYYTPSMLGMWVIKNFDPNSCIIRMEYGRKIKITRELIHAILGIPMGDIKVESLKEKNLADKIIYVNSTISETIRPQLKSNQMEDRVMLNNSQGKKQEVEDNRRNVKFSNNKTSVTACNDSLKAKTSNVNFVCVTCGKCVLNDNHDNVVEVMRTKFRMFAHNETICGVLEASTRGKQELVSLQLGDILQHINTGTQPQYIIEEMAQTIVSTMAGHKSEMKTTTKDSTSNTTTTEAKAIPTKRVVVRLPDPKLKTLGERGIEYIFVGYAKHSKAFRIYVIEPNDSVSINSIIESSDAIFDENRFSLVPRPNLEIPNETGDIGGSVVPKEVVEEVDGTIGNFKAKLVIQGFRQKSGIDYFDTYAPMARISTIRLLIVMTSIHNLIIHQMVVKTSFLNGELDEEVLKKFSYFVFTPMSTPMDTSILVTPALSTGKQFKGY
nr:zinc finger, CCHC-type [Tanacetum cinerariifolium]